jgi:hypothetical protein
MDLQSYVENVHRQLLLAADAGGDDARALAERLVSPLDAALRLALQDAVSAAAEEITCDLAPGSVELRLRGADLEFVVTPPPAAASINDQAADFAATESAGAGTRPTGARGVGDDDGSISRINLRLPEQLKSRVEQAAAAEGLSVNSWLVQAASTAVDRPGPNRRSQSGWAGGGHRYKGWVR